MGILPVKIVKENPLLPRSASKCAGGPLYLVGVTAHRQTGKVAEKFRINCQTGEKTILFKDNSLDYKNK